MKLKTICLALMFTTAIGYFTLAISAPTIGGDPPLLGAIIYLLLGAGFLSAFALGHTHLFSRITKTLQFALGVILAVSAIWSWAGLGLWNVPFADKAPFQISMATLNTIISVAAISLAVDENYG